MKKTLLALLFGGVLLTSQAVVAKNVVIGAPMVAFSDNGKLIFKMPFVSLIKHMMMWKLNSQMRMVTPLVY